MARNERTDNGARKSPADYAYKHGRCKRLMDARKLALIRLNAAQGELAWDMKSAAISVRFAYEAECERELGEGYKDSPDYKAGERMLDQWAKAIPKPAAGDMPTDDQRKAQADLHDAYERKCECAGTDDENHASILFGEALNAWMDSYSFSCGYDCESNPQWFAASAEFEGVVHVRQQCERFDAAKPEDANPDWTALQDELHAAIDLMNDTDGTDDHGMACELYVEANGAWHSAYQSYYGADYKDTPQFKASAAAQHAYGQDRRAA